MTPTECIDTIIRHEQLSLRLAAHASIDISKPLSSAYIQDTLLSAEDGKRLLEYIQDRPTHEHTALHRHAYFALLAHHSGSLRIIGTSTDTVRSSFNTLELALILDNNAITSVNGQPREILKKTLEQTKSPYKILQMIRMTNPVLIKTEHLESLVKHHLPKEIREVKESIKQHLSSGVLSDADLARTIIGHYQNSINVASLTAAVAAYIEKSTSDIVGVEPNVPLQAQVKKIIGKNIRETIQDIKKTTRYKR